jgi:DNA-directed RNA polymerase specialized sigma24 family protein
MPGPDDSGPASVPKSSPGAYDEDAPPSSGPVSARDAEPGAEHAEEGAPPPSGTRARMHAAILAFVSSRKEGEGRDFVIGVVKTRLGADVPRAMLEDIVQASLTEAVECRWPPWFASKVPAWLRRLTHRQIATYFRKEKGRTDEKKKKEEPDPTARPREAAARNLEAAKLEAGADGDGAGHFGQRVEPAERTGWIADRSSPPTDERARARLIHDWLARQIGDSPAKVHTLGLLKQHEVDGFSLAELAKRDKTTERALANRFHKLRKQLVPEVRRMDDERTRRSVIWLLLLLGATVFIALFVWLLLGVLAPSRPPPSSSPPLPVPSLSAVAPPPVFNQALPAPSAPPAPPAPVAPPPQPPARDKP